MLLAGYKQMLYVQKVSTETSLLTASLMLCMQPLQMTLSHFAIYITAVYKNIHTLMGRELSHQL